MIQAANRDICGGADIGSPNKPLDERVGPRKRSNALLVSMEFADASRGVAMLHVSAGHSLATPRRCLDLGQNGTIELAARKSQLIESHQVLPQGDMPQ